MIQEVYEKFKSPSIATEIEVRTWNQLGYFVRMNYERRVKKLLEDKPGGGRKNKFLDYGGWMISKWT